MFVSDRNWFLVAVILYGISVVYSIFLYRRGFRRDNRIHYGLLLVAFCFHTVAMIQRGFSLERCPINNLYEATIFINWTMVAVYLPIGAWRRLRFLGAFASPVLFAVGVFALMPGLDIQAATPTFTGGWASLHKALILLSFGAFGLCAVSALMFLTQEHDLKFHKMRAVLSRLPSIQRLEQAISHLMIAGFILLTSGIIASAIYLKQRHDVLIQMDALMIYTMLVWLVYLVMLIFRWGYNHKGRRMAWGAIVSFAFVMLTFWGIYLLSDLHGQPAPQASRVHHADPSVIPFANDRFPSKPMVSPRQPTTKT